MKVGSFKHSLYCTSSSKFLCLCNVPLLARIRTSSILILPDFTQFMTFSCISLLSCRNNESFSGEMWLFLRFSSTCSLYATLFGNTQQWTHSQQTVKMRKFTFFHASSSQNDLWTLVCITHVCSSRKCELFNDILETMVFLLMSSAVNHCGRSNAQFFMKARTQII